MALWIDGRHKCNWYQCCLGSCWLCCEVSLPLLTIWRQFCCCKMARVYVRIGIASVRISEPTIVISNSNVEHCSYFNKMVACTYRFERSANWQTKAANWALSWQRATNIVGWRSHTHAMQTMNSVIASTTKPTMHYLPLTYATENGSWPGHAAEDAPPTARIPTYRRKTNKTAKS